MVKDNLVFLNKFTKPINNEVEEKEMYFKIENQANYPSTTLCKLTMPRNY